MTDSKDILKRLLTDKLEWEEKKSLSNDEHVEKRMKRQWDETDTETVSPLIEKRILNNINKRINPSKSLFSRKTTWMALAASIFIAFGIFNMVKMSQAQQGIKVFEIYANMNKVYTLPDHTKIWMNEGDTLRYTDEYGKKERKVWIKGTALFDVTRNEKCPFVVCLGQSQIKVLGTSFLVDDRSPELSEITLYTGSVEFTGYKSKEKVMLNPMEKIVYNNHDGSVKLEKALSLFWENGQYRFHELRLDSLISFINTKYKTDTDISKDFDKANLMSGSIQYNESLESVISKLCYNLKAKYRIENNNILIYK